MTKRQFTNWVINDGKIITVRGPRYIVLYGIENASHGFGIFSLPWKLFLWFIDEADWRIFYTINKEKSQLKPGYHKKSHKIGCRRNDDGTLTHYEDDEVICITQPGEKADERISFCGPLYSWKSLNRNIEIITSFTNAWSGWNYGSKV